MRIAGRRDGNLTGLSCPIHIRKYQYAVDMVRHDHERIQFHARIMVRQIVPHRPHDPPGVPRISLIRLAVFILKRPMIFGNPMFRRCFFVIGASDGGAGDDSRRGERPFAPTMPCPLVRNHRPSLFVCLRLMEKCLQSCTEIGLFLAVEREI